MVFKIEDIKEWVKNNKGQYIESKEGNSSFPERKLYQGLVQLLDYYSVTHLCKKALEDLIRILFNSSKDLEGLLSDWVLTYKSLGANKLLMFKIDYLDYSSEENGDDHLFLPQHGVYIEREAFRHIICFYDIFQILYWEMQLTVPENEKEYSLPGDYYYTPPNPIHPLERVKILAKACVNTI